MELVEMVGGTGGFGELNWGMARGLRWLVGRGTLVLGVATLVGKMKTTSAEVECWFY